MDVVQRAIQELTQEEWEQLYRWAILEEKQRRERLAIRHQVIEEILRGGEKSPEPEEVTVDDVEAES